MKMKFGIKEVVATGIGTALFVALTEVQIPLGFIPNTALQPRAALLAFLAAVFGPVVGGIVGLLGHAIGDALFYGSVWWSWVFPDAVFGIRYSGRTFRCKICDQGRRIREETDRAVQRCAGCCQPRCMGDRCAGT